jgi:hypothetical protein
MIIDLIDDVAYATSNCYVHQLTRCMQQVPGVRTVALREMRAYPKPDLVVSRLKQRTLDRHREDIKLWCGDTPVVVYDQDPWYALNDDSPGKGAYDRIRQILNVQTFAVTTQVWVNLMKQQDLPATFVKMGMLPEYCSSHPSWEDRSVTLGFIGTVHPRRQELFDKLDDMGIMVNVQAGNNLSYPDYLRALSNLRVYIHSEDGKAVACGQQMNYRDALWIKDIEAVARGCFTIRNSGSGSGGYYGGLKAALTYNDPSEIPTLLAQIHGMDPIERQKLLDADVELLKQTNVWMETARVLTRST